MFDTLETPRLILDRDRLLKNAIRYRDRAITLGVKLRPHLKTSKCLAVGAIAKDGDLSGITVSTLREARYFAENGYSDILYSTGITPNKFWEVVNIENDTGQRILLVTDNLDIIDAAIEFSQNTHDSSFDFLIEVDSGEHRSGLPACPHGAEDILALAKKLHQNPSTNLKGVMTHAGHSYGAIDVSEVIRIAEGERRSVVDAADMLRAHDIPVEIVSLGSSPTVAFAERMNGVTEVRAGIYLFWDLFQYGRGVCNLDDLALTVLATVIGHNKAQNTLLLDAGGLAMSKDLGASRFLDDAGYGYVCDAETLERIPGLTFDVVHQEHGSVTVHDPKAFKCLPVGAQVRIMPNHACMTAAAYGSYETLEDGKLTETWPRINGWFD